MLAIQLDWDLSGGVQRIDPQVSEVLHGLCNGLHIAHRAPTVRIGVAVQTEILTGNTGS